MTPKYGGTVQWITCIIPALVYGLCDKHCRCQGVRVRTSSTDLSIHIYKVQRRTWLCHTLFINLSKQFGKKKYLNFHLIYSSLMNISYTLFIQIVNKNKINLQYFWKKIWQENVTSISTMSLLISRIHIYSNSHFDLMFTNTCFF